MLKKFMKMRKQYIILALGAMFMASCADEFDRNFEVTRPELSAEYAYLNDYKALKEYVSDPNFKLGIGTDASDYAKQGVTYVVTNVNFTETVAGNAMKMGSCIDEKGSTNFGTVEEYVNAAHEAGLNIYGHTLAWHAQQPVKWLNTLIADKPVPVTPGGEKEVQDYYQDLTTVASFPYYVMGYTPNYSAEEGLISESPGGWYQYFIATGIAANPDTDYILTCEVKSDKSGDVGVQIRWSWGEDPVSTTLKVVEGDWQEISCKFSGVKGSPYDIIFQPGGFDGRFCIKNIKVSHIEQSAGGTVKYWESAISNGDMEGSEAKNFATKSDQGAIVYEIVDGVGKDGSRGAKISSKGGYADAWESQFWIVANEAFPEGTKLRVKFDYKADGGCVGTKVDTQAHFGPGEYQHWACAGSPEFTADWQTYEKEFTVDGSMAGANGMKSIAFNMSPNTSAGNYYIDNVSLEVEREKVIGASVKYMASLISNGDMEGDDAANFATKSDQGAIVYEIVDGVGKDGSRGAKITSKGGYADSWESQFWIVSNEVLTEGQKVHVSFDYKADGGCVGTGVDTQAHFGPGEYQHWACAGTVQFTGDWQTYDKEFTVDGSMAGANGMKSIAFNMSPNTSAGAYYIDNVVLEVEKESTGGGIPQSAEEKKDTLTYAMDKWIHGIMDACKDDDGNMLVKAWEVVNEAIGANGQLQHGKADDTENFFWQDYLGDLDYVRTVVKLARQYGGDDLKLFVNDYNLEYDWDASGNKKLESLISWINKWESDGKTVIDGIGSQMHVSCYADADELAKRKELIIKSFKMMAETGKLIRISELDMGYVDANGNAVKTADMTEDQHHQMAEYYKWIIQQYKANIPAAQQWGITLWCATDAPATSGWRPGEPVGIWDQNFYRKHVYAGIADGLSGE
jgi:GH35 family endo-1,4-beta-xylanase